MSENLLDYLDLRHKPENVNLKHRKTLGLQDRIALFITGAVGTMYAVFALAVLLLGWMLWQSYFDNKPFDPFPFAFLLFLGNVIQLLLMPLIMVGQNIQGQHSELRADEEFKTTESISRDIEKVLIHLDKQDKQLAEHAQLLEKFLSKNPSKS